MGHLEALLYAFLTGLTVTGLAASAIEFATSRAVSFREPFVTPRRILRSVAATVAAGPYMLLNDAMSARRHGRVSLLAVVSCALTSALWVLAAGVAVVTLACEIAVVVLACKVVLHLT